MGGRLRTGLEARLASDAGAPLGEETGLRERKKLLTGEAIEDAALRLYGEKGFEQTSIEDIAQVAVVSPRTVRRYFRSKEEIVFARPQAILGRIEELLGARPEGESVMASLQAVTAEVAAGFEEVKGQWAIRRRLIEAVPSIAAVYLGTWFTTEDALRRFIGIRSGDGPDASRARLAAASAVAVFRVSVEMWLEDDGRRLAEILAENLQRVVSPILRGLR